MFDIIGIIGAMDEEVDILKHHMKIDEISQMAGLEFCQGKMEGRNIVLVRCGIGKVNAAMCTQLLISVFGAAAVINTGVAGALCDELDVLDVVISTDALEHDFDATGFGYKPGEIPRMETSVFEADPILVEAAYKAGIDNGSGHKVMKGRVVTGDVFVSSKDVKDKLVDVFSGACTEMEGASVAHVCALNKIPFVIIRAMSDKADGSAHVNYSEFVEAAAENSKDMVLSMLKSI
ncbi:5'-methylthioadenosine/S-adenosylhomocysteine nucleosidase MtnN [Peptoclostridium acidaminophilum DSM 3953]|uniref:adenosylhomocysteine nucleosidase n=1 Tax=Peptoclostridium acidaminophilum DSM 3953 TaxID=1286171 RepID=W8U7B5_PEPAC|nr:5'-methylthioadenosine/adenosylhomocysteine nucleosidase [Peptoclostridium acidaminophilum]AHM56781.1 5'-methylthioadenosine/S-adenosylhomocysteine nucleosidase MtnN [Peptoclostridium acidaminophilum DSM 3953]